MFRVGVCTSSFEEASFLSSLGYDYLEFGLQTIADLSDDEFELLFKQAEKSPLKVEAFNSLVRKYMVVGSQVDFQKLKLYVAKAFSRAHLLGAQVIVFGSGGARSVPADFPLDIAKNQIIDFLKLTGEYAAKYNMKIAIENLNRSESNIINTVEEELEYVEKCNMPNVGVLADFYHMRLENESFEILKKVNDKLFHTHIANSHGRVYPVDINEDDYISFLSALSSINYNGRISIEAKLIDKSNYESAIIILKGLNKRG